MRGAGVRLNQGRVDFFRQGLIDPEMIFDHDRDCDEKISGKVRLNFPSRLIPSGNPGAGRVSA